MKTRVTEITIRLELLCDFTWVAESALTQEHLMSNFLLDEHWVSDDWDALSVS